MQYSRFLFADRQEGEAMLRQLISENTQAEKITPREGELYKIVRIQGHSFPLIYGYYEECDRQNPAVEPMPIYPDFARQPQYTHEGFPFVTQMQDACQFYQGKTRKFCECAECQFYFQGEELIGICTCLQNKREDPDVGMEDATARRSQGVQEPTIYTEP